MIILFTLAAILCIVIPPAVGWNETVINILSLLGAVFAFIAAGLTLDWIWRTIIDGKAYAIRELEVTTGVTTTDGEDNLTCS